MNKEINMKLSDDSGVVIPAIHTKSARYSKSIIIMCHGITSDKNEYLNFFSSLSRMLSDIDIDTLRFDFRGHGESNYTSKEFSISSQVADLVTVINQLSCEYENIFLLGCSFGSPPCLLLPKEQKKRVKHIFLIAPVLDYLRTFFEPETSWGINTFGSEKINDAMFGKAIKLSDRISLSKEHFIEMSLVDVKSKLDFSQGIDIIHGEKDNMVPKSVSIEWADCFPMVTYHEFENMEHGFTDCGDLSGTSEQTQKNIAKMIAIIGKKINEL